MSLRREVINEQKARFAAITTANGYHFTVKTVAEWQTTPLDEAKLPAVIISDPDDTKRPDDPNSGAHTWDLNMVLDFVLNEAAQTSENADKAIEDFQKAVLVDPRWGQRARRTEEVSYTKRLDTSGARVAGVQIKYKIVTSRKPFTN
jgi:hypothetical protein